MMKTSRACVNNLTTFHIKFVRLHVTQKKKTVKYELGKF